MVNTKENLTRVLNTDYNRYLGMLDDDNDIYRESDEGSRDAIESIARTFNIELIKE